MVEDGRQNFLDMVALHREELLEIHNGADINRKISKHRRGRLIGWGVLEFLYEGRGRKVVLSAETKKVLGIQDDLLD